MAAAYVFSHCIAPSSLRHREPCSPRGPHRFNSKPPHCCRLLARLAIERKRANRAKCSVFSDPENEDVEENVSAKDERFVRWLREAFPYFGAHTEGDMQCVRAYIHAHRGSTFVLIIAAEIADHPCFDGILEVIALLHWLGIKLVIIAGNHVQTDRRLRERGCEPKHMGQYRINDRESQRAAVHAAFFIQLKMEEKLSRRPSICGIHRHGDNDSEHDFGFSIAGGNFIGAKRKPGINGLDFGATGEVTEVDVPCIPHMKLLCVGTEKLICILDGPILDENGHLIRFLALQDADRLISSLNEKFQNSVRFDDDNGIWPWERDFTMGGEERLSQENGYLRELAAAAFVCRGGVERVHLFDGTIAGALLLELFSRDGIGTMVASSHEKVG